MSSVVKRDLVGQRIGKLIVEDEYHIVNKKRTKWKCKCDCGSYTWVARDHLVSGAIRSCGCYRKKTNSIGYGESSCNRVFRRYKRDAKRRNLDFVLTKEQFVKLCQSNCYYCGIDPSNIQKADGNNGDWIYNGIDRVDNNQGYVLENCVPCCAMCNKSKLNIPEDQFIEWVLRASKHIKDHLLCERSNV